VLNSLLRALERVVDSALNLKIQEEGYSRVGKGTLERRQDLAEQEDWSGSV